MKSSNPKLSAPSADRRKDVSFRFGQQFIDPYAWLRDPNWQLVMQNPEKLKSDIGAHLQSENAYAEKFLAPIADLRNVLFQELQARIEDKSSTVPLSDGNWAYYERFNSGGQHPIFCRRPLKGGEREKEQVLLDVNEQAKEEKFLSVGSTRHSPNHKLYATAMDRNGSEFYEITIKNLDTDEPLPTRLENAQGDMEFSADSQILFYTVLDQKHRPTKVMRHSVGVDKIEDALVYEELDPSFFIQLDKTESGRFITISCYDHAETAEVRLIDTKKPTKQPRLISARKKGVKYDVHDSDDQLLIHTNIDGAVDFKVVKTSLLDPDPKNWKEFVNHKEGRLIRSIILFKDHLVRLEREHALPKIVIKELSTGKEHLITFNEEAYDLALQKGYEFKTEILRFSYSSPTVPKQIYDYNLVTKERLLRKEQVIPSGHDPQAYSCRRLFATGHDGEKIPVTILHKKDLPLNGRAPLLLYGYGSYGYSMPADFSANVYSLVDRGMVYAIAHIRGGTENGFNWYLNGKLRQKKNTFFDFIATAEFLIEKRYTKCGQIVAQGRSAGGMLMGAVANLRPDLFRGIIAEVPFVDVVNTISDETLPLTPPEWDEWGDPIHKEEDLKFMTSYCPYSNITNQAYPFVLATGGLTDPRVTYWEPAKWVAKLRHHNTSKNEIICWINMEAGHGGASGRYDRLKETSLSYGFALMITNKNGEHKT